MKRVLIIIGKLSVGGAEKVARDIGYYADKEKYDIHYLVFGDDVNHYEKELIDNGCRIIHVPSPSDNHLAYYKTLMNLIKKEKYDVIHSHTMFSSGWAVYAGYKCGVPIRISHSHSIRGHEKRGFIKNAYENTMRQVVVKYSTHYIGCGKDAGYWLFGKEKFDKNGIIIFNGIDLESYRFDLSKREVIRKQLGIGGKIVLGHAGHFADVKNQQFLVKLLPEMLKVRDDTILLLLGDGETRKEIEELAQQLGVREYVIFTGNVDNVGDYLSAMDVFVFPSKYEGMPLALIEAQANGLPCIISEKIPKDVYLTDLLVTLSISEDSEKEWIQAIINSARTDPDKYYKLIRTAGFDSNDMLEKIYALYNGDVAWFK